MCVCPIAIKINNVDGVRNIQVPCGKCFECLKTKQNDYMVRIYEEMMQVSKSCFLTLTYSNDTVPYLVRDGKKFLTVWKQDVKDWIKRFRTNYERKTGVKGIRYFLCSEYGPKTHRPHYHAIFFGLSCSDMEIALNDWRSRFGFVMAKDVNYNCRDMETVARYVSKYASKGVFEDPFCCEQKPSEAFSTFLKRIRRDLHIPYGCFPYVFALSSTRKIWKDWLVWEWHDDYRCAFSENYAGFNSSFACDFEGYVFRRGLEAQTCPDWSI